MQRLIRRLRACETGEGLVEYGMLIALVALALIGVLTAFRNMVGGATNRTAVAISTQSAGGYGGASGPSGIPVSLSPAKEEAPTSPDSSSPGAPDSSGTTTQAHLGIFGR
jgi:Flp pilus assembly pilin Flp